VVFLFALPVLAQDVTNTVFYTAAPDPTSAITPSVMRIVINIPTRNLILYQNGIEVKRFQVGVGRPEFPTPVGNFSVIQMNMNPAWENPYLGAGKMRIAAGARNPLGTRWIGFKEDGKGQYGMHGTDNPKSVGQYSSHGCVRMFIRDAEELFNWVSYGTPVDVTYNPVIVNIADNRSITAAVYPDKYRRGYPSVSDVTASIQRAFPLAIIDSTALAQALKRPNGKRFVIGRLSDPRPITTDANGGATLVLP
jgi:L,D-transpeptidase catalytic domain